MTTTCGGLPVDVARIIAHHVIAQPRKASAFTAPPRGAHADRGETLMHRHPAESFHASQRWCNEDLVLLRTPECPRGESQPCTDPYCDAAEWRVPACRSGDLEWQRRRSAIREYDRIAGRPA